MTLKPIATDIEQFPGPLRPILEGASMYDSSCSEAARVIFIDKDGGYFLKSASYSLQGEEYMTRYFHSKGLSAEVIAYLSDEGKDWLLTRKLNGDDCIAAKYLEQPERLCGVLAESLLALHSVDCSDCLIKHSAEDYIQKAKENYARGIYNKELFPDNWGYATPEDAWNVIRTRGHLFKTDTLLHGDYCLPNIILDDWKFSGFIDLDSGGAGDRHVDIFWGTWSLFFNLKTDKYRDRLLDAYGRSRIDEDMLRVVAAVEVFK
ncbi:MAG: aminoglycoside 3'-phosphotransferase [Oscillospiraceae bacterium]|jgi:kanamycin kinase|nr:aminoglycoside 3'-phosphotransferase [Oscillospiraceae bacterium]